MIGTPSFNNELLGFLFLSVKCKEEQYCVGMIQIQRVV